MADSLSLHEEHNELSRHPRAYARDAALAAHHCSEPTDAEVVAARAVHRSANRAKHNWRATVDISGAANLVHTSSTHSAWLDVELFEATSAEPEDFDTQEVQRLLEVAKESGVDEVLLSPARTALAAHLWLFSTFAWDFEALEAGEPPLFDFKDFPSADLWSIATRLVEQLPDCVADAAKAGRPGEPFSFARHILSIVPQQPLADASENPMNSESIQIVTQGALEDVSTLISDKHAALRGTFVAFSLMRWNDGCCRSRSYRCINWSILRLLTPIPRHRP